MTDRTIVPSKDDKAIGYSLEIVTDPDPINPREDYDSACKMVCWHNRYNLGDEQPKSDPQEYLESLLEEADSDTMESMRTQREQDYEELMERFNPSGPDWPEYASEIERKFKDELEGQLFDEHYVMLPLYLYDHSGITISTGRFSCPWDSGQVGWVFMTQAKVDEEFGGDRDKAIKYMEGEVETYDSYLRGECYGFIVRKHESCGLCDGCSEADIAGGLDIDQCEEPEEKGEVDSCWGFLGDPRESMKGEFTSYFGDRADDILDEAASDPTYTRY